RHCISALPVKGVLGPLAPARNTFFENSKKFSKRVCRTAAKLVINPLNTGVKAQSTHRVC
ncbi:hypothetical protein, partial [Litoreibacter halocynthiae]|uniref:hypothetical protein n=1 Tax=Litoreibacter halocynthiae TaxID=1242689 RepID=UPI001B85C835